MRIGFTEILIIGAIILLLLGVSRVFSPNTPTPTPPARPARPLTATEARDAEILARRRSSLKGWGVALLLVGFVLFLGSFKIFDYFWMGLGWGGALLILGALLLFLPRRSR